MYRLGWYYVSVALIFLLIGCATRGGGEPTGRETPIPGTDAGTDPTRPRQPTATISGVVWAPGNAPGMVAPGHEIPVFDAVVRLTTTRPEPIPQNTFCERCLEVGGFYAQADHRGAFTLAGITPASYWISVQKGQFRIEKEITLESGQELVLPQEMTTLPSIHDPANGAWVPRIAVATGNYDDIQDVLGKMSIGTVDGEGGYSMAPGSEVIDFYENGGESYPGMAGSLGDLVRSLDRMLQYHIIFIPCAGTENTTALSDQNVLRNIRDYVAAGGKLYVTDWSGEWHDNVFPEQITLGDSGGGYYDYGGGSSTDTPAAAYNREADTWNTSMFGDADGSSYDSPDGQAVDEQLFAWLNGQTGPTPEEGIQSYDASHFEVVDNWNTIERVNAVQIGLDDEGLPILDNPQVYVIGSNGSGPKKPLTVTYEPTGCGRVLYSTYHTTDSAHLGLVPQERILLYLIMEIGICKEGPILI